MKESLNIIPTIIENNAGERSASTTNDLKGEYGRIDKAMVSKYADTNAINNSLSCICDPPGMLKDMQSLIQEYLEIPKHRIKIEEFTGY